MLEYRITQAIHQFQQQGLDGTKRHFTQGHFFTGSALPFWRRRIDEKVVDFKQELIRVQHASSEVVLHGFG
jgi:hypothetical protein